MLCALVISSEALGQEVSSQATSTKESTTGRRSPDRDNSPTDEESGTKAAELEEPLNVGYSGSPPFVKKMPSGTPAGASIEVWQQIAQRMDVSFELHARESVDKALEDLRSGELDVAIGPISITAERARFVAFTQPYARSSLAIASQPQSSFWTRVRPFLSRAFFSGLFGLMFVLAIVGTLMWLVERKRNSEQFPTHPLLGIGNGIWFALVTMTTVGYGDRTPVTPAGRVIAGAWMLIALITVSSLTAGIATALTVSQLGTTAVSTADELRSRRVAGTISNSFARNHGAIAVPVADLPAAIELVKAGEAEAVVFDRPALEHYLSNHPEVELEVSPRRYKERGYGFAVNQGSPLRARMDIALLKLREEGKLDLPTQDD